MADEKSSPRPPQRIVLPSSTPRELGGDPACWLPGVCPACGAFNESASDRCWHCGRIPDQGQQTP